MRASASSSVALSNRSRQRERGQARAAEQANLQLQAAQYEADRAFEQFDNVDPKNRLVADTPELRLNNQLVALGKARQHVEDLQAAIKPLTIVQRTTLAELARDFSRVWNHPDTPVATKKRLARTAIHEVIATHPIESKVIEVVIHWQGGVHKKFEVQKRVAPIGAKKLANGFAATMVPASTGWKRSSSPIGARTEAWRGDGSTEAKPARSTMGPGFRLMVSSACGYSMRSMPSGAPTKGSECGASASMAYPRGPQDDHGARTVLRENKGIAKRETRGGKDGRENAAEQGRRDGQMRAPQRARSVVGGGGWGQCLSEPL